MSSSHKNHNLYPYQLIKTQIVSGNVSSDVTDIFYKDNIGIQLVWDGTLDGSFDVQISADYSPQTGIGSWDSIPLGGIVVASGTPDSWFLDLNELSGRYLQIVFTYVSGSGNLTAWILGKAV